jgi:Na+/phosphate symporter
MFRDIIQTMKRTPLVYDAVQETLNMLVVVQRMFGSSCDVVFKGKPMATDLERDDDAINTGERLVRRMIVQHLTMNPSQDLPTSLALLSIIHDVERIGDYSKSLIELKDVGFELEEGSAHRNEACELHATIVPLFDQTLTALRESDADVARLVMNTHEEIKERTDQLLAAAVKGGGQGTGAMLYPLALRFLRRVSAHLSNIASSVGNPVDQISSDATSA